MKKKTFFGLTAVAIAIVAIVACTRGFEKFDARETDAGLLAACDPETCWETLCEIEREGVDTLPSIITGNVVLDHSKTWIMKGKVYVDDGARLTIPSGTLIKAMRTFINADPAALVVTRGGRLYAEGTVDCPIVFTSNEAAPAPGDWGGIALLGRAPINKPDKVIEGIYSVPAGIDINYGGGGAGLGNCDDTSGTLHYVRIEYAGAIVSSDNELNGLTCGGVGKGTRLSYIQVYKSGEDAFEFFGGTVNADHLYAYVPNDDAFDFDLGYNGSIQFAVSVLNNTAIYSQTPNGVESDNDFIGTSNAPRTKARISNMTVVGVCDSIDSKRPGDVLLFGAHFRRHSSYVIFNSIFMGFPSGVFFDGAGPIGDIGCFKYNLVHAFDTVMKKSTVPRLLSCLPTNKCYRTGNANDSIKLVLPCRYDCPDFRPLPTSPAISGANFTDACIATCCTTKCTNNVNFFQTVSYRGAFNRCDVVGSNWLAGWTKHPAP